MNKLTSLSAHILSNPDLLILPADLLTFASGMKILSSASGTNEHFEFKYTGNIIITNYSGQLDQLAYWLLLWLKVNQPDHAEEAVNFDADILNDVTGDISLTINLSETIKVEQTVDGILLHHVDEPSIDPVLLTAPQWTLYANNEAVAEWMAGG